MSKTAAERARDHRARKKMQLLHRDGAICRICGQPIDMADLSNVEIDHRVPRARGGSDDPKNLQPAHKDCNRAKLARPQASLHRLLDAARFALETIGRALALNTYEGVRIAMAVTDEACDALNEQPRSPNTVTNGGPNGNERDGLRDGLGEEGEGLSRSSLGSLKSQRLGLREATESQDRKSDVTVTSKRDAGNSANDEPNGDSHVQRTAAAVTSFGAERELKKKPLKDAEMVAKAGVEAERLKAAFGGEK